jgi:hypothetical protein
MSVLSVRLLTGLMLGAALSFAVASRVAAQAPLLVLLFPVGAGDARATAIVAPNPDLAAPGAALTIEATGLAPNARHTAHVHAGGCARPSASVGLLGSFVADGTGRGQLVATTAGVSASDRRVELSLDWLADGDHFLDLHDAAGTMVACGAVPTADSPGAQPTNAPGAPPTASLVQLPRTGWISALAAVGLGGALLVVGTALRRR